MAGAPESYIYRRDASLMAVSDLDGSVVWGPLPLAEDTFGPLYDAGRVYTMGGSGTLQAWDARAPGRSPPPHPRTRGACTCGA